jgi:hypothetical protein
MKYFILIFISLLLSCNNSPKKKVTETKNKALESKEVTLTPTKNEPTLKIKEKRFYEFDECQCPKPFNEAYTHSQFEYSNDILKFCSFDFDFKTKKMYEFEFYDKNDSLLLRGDIPNKFVFQNYETPITVIQETNLPSDSSNNWNYTPVFKHTFLENEKQLTVQTEFILETPQMTQNIQDSILTIFTKQPLHYNKYDKFNPPFANEQFVMDLFICAFNNKNCSKAFDSLQTRFITDRAGGELFYQLSGIHRSWKENQQLLDSN